MASYSILMNPVLSLTRVLSPASLQTSLQSTHNVVILRWDSLSAQHFFTAMNNIPVVGQELAVFLATLKVSGIEHYKCMNNLLFNKINM